MKLTALITELEQDRYNEFVGVNELGMSRKGNRKLEIQQVSVWLDDDEYHESVMCLFVVVDDEENILSKTEIY